MKQTFLTVCRLADRAAAVFCNLLVMLIVLVIFAEISARIFFGVPVPHSQEIAQLSLVWLTFIGAATAWRHNRHIIVELESFTRHRHSRLIEIFATLVSAAAMIALGSIIVSMAPMMMRLTVGTLQITRFSYGFLPLLIASVLIVLFAVERLLIGEIEPQGEVFE